jgi:hypothetical protein
MEQGDMTRYSSKSMDEVPDKDSDNARRRTRPADHKPWSPAAIDRLYAKGKESPDMKASQKEYENQDPIDRHGPKYRNDVPLEGDRAWLRGGGEYHHIYGSRNQNPAARPKMDRGNKASGQDMHKSPFSAAHKTYGED